MKVHSHSIYRIERYKPCFFESVLECLQRNFKKDSKEVGYSEQLNKLTNYHWCNDRYIKNMYGEVLVVNNDEVVGFFGRVSSVRYIGDKWVQITNPSTWVVDRKYRFHFFQAVSNMINDSDIVLETTSNDSVYRANKELLHYEDVCKYTYKVLFVLPGHCLNNMKELTNSNNMPTTEQQIYNDHHSYPIKCVCFVIQNKPVYIYYRNVSSKIKGIPALWSYILRVSDRTLFSNNLQSILYCIQRTENRFIEFDSLFLFDKPANLKGLYFKLKCHKTIKRKQHDIYIEDYMYTEIAMFNHI